MYFSRLLLFRADELPEVGQERDDLEQREGWDVKEFRYPLRTNQRICRAFVRL